jgi:hypothetical protein
MPSQPLTPEQCFDRIIIRLRKRIATLDGMNMTEYRVATSELRNVVDLLTRARNYIADVSNKLQK